MERLWKTYVLISDDGSEKDAFIYWDKVKGYYTSTEWIDELDEQDFLDTIEAAITRANEVDSSTFGGWNWSPIKIMELLNFSKAYNEGEVPELVEVLTLTF